MLQIQFKYFNYISISYNIIFFFTMKLFGKTIKFDLFQFHVKCGLYSHDISRN
jgi:hypothetical protein